MLSFSATWYLGTLTLGTFLILVVTGILLMLYYHPSVPQAYADMKDLQFVVSSGRVLRNLHRWSAHAMVFLVFAHMFKVFYRGAYRTPREFNWVIGIVLLLITLLLSYTGYLLAMGPVGVLGDHRRIEYRIRGAAHRRQDPLPDAGRHTVNANALLRFYVLHCMILPLTAILFVAIHFWRIRKDGGLYNHDSEPARVRAQQSIIRRGGEIDMADSKDFVAGIDSNAPSRRAASPSSPAAHRRKSKLRPKTSSRLIRKSFFARPSRSWCWPLCWCDRVDLNAPLKDSPTRRTPRIRQRRPGISWDCRRCCTTSRRSLPACWCPGWW